MGIHKYKGKKAQSHWHKERIGLSGFNEGNLTAFWPPAFVFSVKSNE